MALDRLPLSQITPNPDQPRKLFREDKLRELAASIEEHGLMEPIVVVRRGDKYQIIGGERRWRACQMTKRYLDRPVPVRCLVVSRDEQEELSIIENLQREDLTLVEEASAYQSMLDRGLSVEEVARRLGLKQPWRITERTSLLRLLPEFQDALSKGILTPSQAYEMSRLEHTDQRELFRLIGQGKAPDYNRLRALANAMLARNAQPSFFAPPDPKHQEVRAKYDKLLDSVLGLINRSFDADDLSVLRVALQGNLALNIERIDMIVKHLGRVKKALVEAHGVQMVLGEEVAA
ncbi:ParB/RepB/Spo0J family partition protein [Desulfarculus baarsii]